MQKKKSLPNNLTRVELCRRKAHFLVFSFKSLVEIVKGSGRKSGKFKGVLDIPNDSYALIFFGGPI